VFSDLAVTAVKIGMLSQVATIEAVAAGLARHAGRIPIVLDPVMVATSGDRLISETAVEALRRHLLPLAHLVTPNLPELAALGGEAAVLAHGGYLLAKGGHAEGDMVVDRLIGPQGVLATLRGPRIDTRHSHGTGCTLASALATGLGAGLPVEVAFARAVRLVRAALAAAPGLGAGHGPIGHTLGLVPFDVLEDECPA